VIWGGDKVMLHYGRAEDLRQYLNLIAIRGEVVVQFWLRRGAIKKLDSISKYQISIYKNVVAGNPVSGTLVKTISGAVAKSGYNTLATYAAASYWRQAVFRSHDADYPGLQLPNPTENACRRLQQCRQCLCRADFSFRPGQQLV
jgi:hypothetical protein